MDERLSAEGLSPFGVRATCGTLRDPAPDASSVVLPHAWTDEGVLVGPATNGAQLLHLAVAVCVLNDTYREAQRLGVAVDGVEVTADGGFDDLWASTGISYTLTIDAAAPADRLHELIEAVDEAAEIPKALRAGAKVVHG